VHRGSDECLKRQAGVAPTPVLAKRKKFVACERDTPENTYRRLVVAATLLTVSAEKLVFLDESFCSNDMAREHGWGPIGQRVFGSRPGRSWKTLTLLGAIRLGSKPLLATHHGSVNRIVFLEFVEEHLVPWLRPGDVVVMDNLSSHKVSGVREALESAGAVVLYLPPYSPDMNPIELWWSDVKRQLRTRAARTLVELEEAAREIADTTEGAKVAAWFRHALRFGQVK
jgi:transposase